MRGLHDISFTCGKHGHREVHCTAKPAKNSNEDSSQINGKKIETNAAQTAEENEPSRKMLGPRVVAMRPRWRTARNGRGTSVNA